MTDTATMSDIRLRPRSLLIAIACWLFVTYLLVRQPRGGGDAAAVAGGPAMAECARQLAEALASSVRRNQPASGATVIYAITPTYARPVQKAELTRLAQTIMLQPNVHWILVEDSLTTTDLVRQLLARSGLAERSTQLNVKTPADFKLGAKDPNWSKPRGVEQRNAGLAWLRQRLDAQTPAQRADQHSVVYFMDDDNSYSLQLFAEMSAIGRGKVAVWPVGLVGGLRVERPVLVDGEVIGFNSAWRPERPFPLDMAGFAISCDLLRDYPQAVFSYEVQRGYQESEILRQLVTVRDLQPLARGCTEVLVWHTRTEAPKLEAELRLKKTGQPASDDGMEV